METVSWMPSPHRMLKGMHEQNSAKCTYTQACAHSMACPQLDSHVVFLTNAL